MDDVESSMLDIVEKWIDKTLDIYSEKRISCQVFLDKFEGYYPQEFLNSSCFVIVDEVPKPDFPKLHEMGLTDFIKRDFDGITYKNTYFIKKDFEGQYNIHFHELVHVA